MSAMHLCLGSHIFYFLFHFLNSFNKIVAVLCIFMTLGSLLWSHCAHQQINAVEKWYEKSKSWTTRGWEMSLDKSPRNSFTENLLRGVTVYLEYWHSLLPGNPGLFARNYADFYYSFSLHTSSFTSGKKVLPFFSICAFVPIPPGKTFIKCLLYAVLRPGSCSQFCPPPLSSFSSSHPKRHTAPAQQASQISESNWTLGGGMRWEALGCFRRVLGALVSVPHHPRARVLPVKAILHAFSSESYVQIL